MPPIQEMIDLRGKSTSRFSDAQPSWLNIVCLPVRLPVVHDKLNYLFCFLLGRVSYLTRWRIVIGNLYCIVHAGRGFMIDNAMHRAEFRLPFEDAGRCLTRSMNRISNIFCSLICGCEFFFVSSFTYIDASE